MITLALLVWLAVEQNMVAPWWVWTVWAVFFIAKIIHGSFQLAKQIAES